MTAYQDIHPRTFHLNDREHYIISEKARISTNSSETLIPFYLNQQLDLTHKNFGTDEDITFLIEQIYGYFNQAWLASNAKNTVEFEYACGQLEALSTLLSKKTKNTQAYAGQVLCNPAFCALLYTTLVTLVGTSAVLAFGLSLLIAGIGLYLKINADCTNTGYMLKEHVQSLLTTAIPDNTCEHHEEIKRVMDIFAEHVTALSSKYTTKDLDILKAGLMRKMSGTTREALNNLHSTLLCALPTLENKKPHGPHHFRELANICDVVLLPERKHPATFQDQHRLFKRIDGPTHTSKELVQHYIAIDAEMNMIRPLAR